MDSQSNVSQMSQKADKLCRDGATDYEDEEANELEADELHLKQTFLKATEDRAVRSHDGKSQVSIPCPRDGPQD